jgi:ammonia channel protein AmtB
MQFLAPVSDRDLVLGKAAGVGLMLGFAMIPCVAAAAALAPGGSLLEWASVPLEVLAVYAVTAPLAAFLSAFFPKTADLSKLSSAGNAHGFAGVLGVLGTGLAAAPPAAMSFLIGGLLGRPALALGLVAAWSLLCLFAGWSLLRGVAHIAGERRENLVLVARGR